MKTTPDTVSGGQHLLRITLCQADLRWEDPGYNRRRLRDLTASLPGGRPADLLVLPEFFPTGFSLNPAFAEAPGGPSLQWMQELSCRLQCAVSGTVPVRESAARLVNRHYFVTPEGPVYQYDKKHLFSIGAETGIFSPGTETVTVPWRGWRIRLATCYDLRFPVWLRNRELDYDLLLCSACWPASRIGATEYLIKARSIENLCYTAFCNRCGDEPELPYNGGSRITDCKGGDMAEPVFGREALLSAELSRPALDSFRSKFPAWKDADAFTLKK